MELIMSNPTEREWSRMRRDAEIDRRTEIRDAERKTKREMAKGMKAESISKDVIARITGLSATEIDAL